MSSMRNKLKLMQAVSQGIVEQAERIAKEADVMNVEDVIGAWLSDTLYHDMRDSTVRYLTRRHNERARVGLPMPEEPSQ